MGAQEIYLEAGDKLYQSVDVVDAKSVVRYRPNLIVGKKV
jgi:hypothetical protein